MVHQVPIHPSRPSRPTRPDRRGRAVRVVQWTAVLAALVLVAAACGDDDDDASGSTAATTASTVAASSTTTAAPSATTGVESTEPAAPAGPPGETAGFDGTTIRVGCLTDQSGPVAVIGNPLLQGAQLWFDHVNAQGGVAGQYPVAVVPGDTHDDAATAVQEYQRVKDDVVMFANILSTPPTQAVLE